MLCRSVKTAIRGNELVFHCYLNVMGISYSPKQTNFAKEVTIAFFFKELTKTDYAYYSSCATYRILDILGFGIAT